MIAEPPVKTHAVKMLFELWIRVFFVVIQNPVIDVIGFITISTGGLRSCFLSGAESSLFHSPELAPIRAVGEACKNGRYGKGITRFGHKKGP